MLKDALKAVGKSLLIVTGVSYGIVRALEMLRPTQDTPTPQPPPDNPAIQRLDSLVDSLGERLTRLETSLGQNEQNFVTRTDLDTALGQFSSDLNADIERRFDVQNRSVQSLRTMVARTDELLEQVLESIESASVSA